MAQPKSRKEIRWDSLHKHFQQTHNNALPHGKYEHYILKCIIHLGEVYDENQDLIRATIREGMSKNQAKLEMLRNREEFLNNLGHLMREALAMQVVAGKDLKEEKRSVEKKVSLDKTEDAE